MNQSRIRLSGDWPAFSVSVVLVSVALVLALWVGGCGADEDVILGPADQGAEEDVFAWLWAFDADEDSLRVYDANDGTLRATFFAQPHPVIRELIGGPPGEPGVYMGSGGTAFAFSAGFVSHGDHAHMELPRDRGRIATGGGNTHLSADAHGQTVCFANDGDQTFTLVDTETLAPTTVSHGSPHSACVVEDGVLLATHMHEKWARLIDIQADTILAEVAIDTLVHGEAFHHETGRVFLPCLHGIDIVGLEEATCLGTIAYPGAGRVNFLFQGHDSERVLAPVRLGEGHAAGVWILDMATRELQDLPMAGAALAWNRGGGRISVSADGSTAVLTDLEQARAYVVDLAAGSYQSLNTAEAAMPCATDHGGRRIWLLDPHDGAIHCRHHHEGLWEEEEGFTIHAGSDWIFVTSPDPAMAIIRDY